MTTLERRNRTRGTLAASALALAAFALVTAARADDEKKAPRLVKAVDAKDHIDENCTVELTVKASKDASGRQEYYLDSEEDFRDEKNFAVVIHYDHADAFKKAGVDNPAEYYRDKTIRVTGKIIRENDQVRIRVEDPAKIKVVEKKD